MEQRSSPGPDANRLSAGPLGVDPIPPDMRLVPARNFHGHLRWRRMVTDQSLSAEMRLAERLYNFHGHRTYGSVWGPPQKGGPYHDRAARPSLASSPTIRSCAHNMLGTQEKPPGFHPG